MDWEDCKRKGFVKKLGFVDESLIKSLIRSSENKLSSAKLLPLNETTISSTFSLYYDSLRELLEALAIKNKIKIYNHECFKFLLGKYARKDALAFDQIRKMRNSINYYGRSISREQAQVLLTDLNRLINKVKLLLKMT